MAQRGWSPERVRDIIDDPVRTVPTRDTRNRPEGAGKMDDPATGYVDADGDDVVRNDRTGRHRAGVRSPPPGLEGALGLVPRLAEAAGIVLVDGYVQVPDALRFLDEAQRAGAAVLGIDALAKEGDRVVPLMDEILDLSTAEDPSQTIEDARRFVQTLSPRAALLDVVLDEPSRA